MAAALLQMGEIRAGCRCPAECATIDGTHAWAQTPCCGQELQVLRRTACCTPARAGRCEVLPSTGQGVQVQKEVKSVSWTAVARRQGT